MVLPSSFSFFRKRFSSRKSLFNTSSFSCASHESCRLLISSWSRSFCSSVSFSTQASLSNFRVAAGAPKEEKALTGLAEDDG